MILDLEAGSELVTVVLYDPAAVPDGVAEDEIDRQVEEGNLFAWVAAEAEPEGWVLFRVFVDQEPPAGLLAKQGERVSGVLRIPSGRLCAAGLEELDGPPGAAPESGAAASIEAGDYELEAFGRVLTDEDYDDKVRAVLGSRDYEYRELVRGLTEYGCMATAAALLTVFFLSWRAWFLFVVASFALYWAVVMMLRRGGRFRRLSDLATRVWIETIPALVVVRLRSKAPG